MIIPAGSEKQWCFFFSYDGPDVGVNIAQNWQNPDYGHHAQLMQYNVAASEEFPDGSVFDCTEDDDLPMTDMEPIYIPADAFEPGFTEMNLPEGFATILKSGARLVLQSHYINYRAEPILVRDVVNLHFTPVEEVETWVAPWVTVYTNLELPALEETEISFDCTWGEDIGPFNADVYLLSALGHMHEWGTAFSLEHGLAGEGAEPSTLYEIPEWDPEFRDAPPMNAYGLDAYKVSPGDVFTTTCRWFNDTDSMIDFPQEMCVATGMAYSRDVDLKVPMLCDPS